MDLQIVTAPSTQAVDIEIVRQNMRVTNAAEDSLIRQYIEAAQELIAAETNRAIMVTEFRLTLDKIYPKFRLPRPPFVAFASMSYKYEDEAAVAIDTSGMTYRVQDMLPEFELADFDVVTDGLFTVQWTAGWTPEALPATLKQAVIMLASHLYQNRSSTFMDPRLQESVKELPFFRRLFETWRVPNVNDDHQARYT